MKFRFFFFLILCLGVSSPLKYSFCSLPDMPDSEIQQSSADLMSFKLVGQVGGPTQAVAIKGNHAYVGIGMRMLILDVSNPLSVQQLGETPVLDGFVTGVAISGAKACLTAGAAGVYIVDISSPAQPSLLGAFVTPGYAENIFVEGSYAYVADGSSGLTVVDISDPSKPKQVGSLSTIGYAFDVAVAGQTAYIAAAGAGLKVVDVQYPSGPIAIGELNTSGYAFGLAYSNGIVYLADGWGGLQVINVSDPSQPISLGSRRTPGWAFGVSLEGSFVYVADAFKGLRIIDVSSPASPSEIGSFEADGHAGRVFIAGSKAYVADRNNGLRIIDVVNPSSPLPIGLYSPLGYAREVAVSGNNAYVAGGSYHLRVIDVLDPARPKEIGRYDTESFANCVSVSGNYAYVGTYPGQVVGALHVVDISDPKNPRKLGIHHVNYPSAFRDMVISNGMAYIANEYGINLIDVSDPFNPFRAGFINFVDQLTGGATVGIDVDGTLAYVTKQRDGIEVVNISNPKNLVRIGAFKDDSSFSEDITVVGNKAYVAEYHMMRVFDVSSPAAPRELGRINSEGQASEVEVDGSTAFVANGSSGILAIDVSNPSALRVKGHFNSPGFSSKLQKVGKLLYVAGADAGLLILEVQETAGSSQLSSRPVDYSPIRYIHPGPRHADNGSGTRRLSGNLIEQNILNSGKPLGSTMKTSQTWVVTTTADAGVGSLRWCMENARNGANITFDPAVFPPGNPATIFLISDHLPTLIQGNVTIDASNAGVILNGRNLPEREGFYIKSNGNIIRGMQIINFPDSGVVIESGEGNIIGGDRAVGRGPVGQGNVISGNGKDGIGCEGNKNTIIGNLIGVDVSGTLSMGNAKGGIFVKNGLDNIIGGSQPGERNIISGNGYTGISLQAPGTRRNIVSSNYIGTDITGQHDLENKDNGVNLELGASNNIVKENLISANRVGICISDWGSCYNTVIGNIIGLDSSGQKALGNQESGVAIGYYGASFNRVGGTSAEERNIIGANRQAGVDIYGPSGRDNFILGNYVGTDISGTKAVGNFVGVRVLATDHNFIGDVTDKGFNVISGNEYGIQIEKSDSNYVAGNCIGMSADRVTPLHNQYYGIQIGAETINNALSCNLISGDSGVSLMGDENILRGNTFTQSNRGIETSGNHNIIFYNKFLNNQKQASDSGSNSWDRDGAGNYWSDYSGSDANNDGIGDRSYSIPNNGTDHYPLMKESNVLTIRVNPPGSGSVTIIPTKSSYEYGENVRLKAYSSGDKPFYSWSGGCPSGKEGDNPLTVRMNSDRTITANFIRQYKLTIETSTGGTTDPSPGTYFYDGGTAVSIKAIPDTGYKFSGWTGDVPSGHQNDSPLSILMDADKTLKANFTQKSTDSGEKGVGGRCFIATACYGTPMAEEVKALCAFRDRYLLENPIGRGFIAFYYRYSPKLAVYIEDKPVIKAIIREWLKPFIFFAKILSLPPII